MQAAAPAGNASKDKDKEEIQGVFVIRDRKAEFVPVDVGIAGATDIEVLKGLKEGDEIVTGQLQSFAHTSPRNCVKIDNSAPKKEEESS